MVDLSRQRLIITGNPRSLSLLIIGAGGIGSNIAYVAASMGVEKITVYDNDTVGEENIAAQFYKQGHGEEGFESDLDFPKTDSLRENIALFTGVNITTHNERYTNQVESADVVIVGVDDMATRRVIWMNSNIEARWWVDGRMGDTQASVWAFNPRDKLEAGFYSHELTKDAEELPCGLKSTAYITKGWLSGMNGTVLAHIINGTPPPYLMLGNFAVPWIQTLSVPDWYKAAPESFEKIISRTYQR